jgi:hypothetical protein
VCVLRVTQNTQHALPQLKETVEISRSCIDGEEIAAEHHQAADDGGAHEQVAIPARGQSLQVG